MIITIDDDSLTSDPGNYIYSAISDLFAAMRLGHHRVLIAPSARKRLEEHNANVALLSGWSVVEASWLEGQAFARTLSRIITLTDDPARAGMSDGNRYYVHFSDLDVKGILKEPTFVMENMATDARLIRTYMPILLELGPIDFKRFWGAKPEQGGGNTISTYVERHTQEPNPIALILDRDSDTEPGANSTANTCFKQLVSHGVFPNKPEALTGGFSPTRPNIAVHTLHAWAIENLIFPDLMELFFVHIAPANGHGDTSRRVALVSLFPNFPNLNEAEAEAWLKTKFKKNPAHNGANIFDSGCINRLLDWTQSDANNAEVFGAALVNAINLAPFGNALRGALRDLWSIGHRYKSVV